MFSSQAFGASQGLTMGFAGSQAAEGGAGKKGRQDEGQSCLPVTIRSIEAAVAQREDGGGGDLRFFGTEPAMLVLVGAVETVVKQAASLEFTLNDATGRIKARHFATDQQPKDLDEIVPGRYVSLYGSVRTAPMVHFAAMGVQLVRSADEISYHAIESAHAALKLQKGQKEISTPSPKKAPAPASGEDVHMDTTITPPKEEPALGAVPAVAAKAGGEGLEGEALRAAVVAYIQGSGKEEGVHESAVCSHFGQSTGDAIRAALGALVDLGELYTTLDEQTYAAL